MNIPGEAAQQLGQLNATSLPGAVNFQDLWAALTKASAGKGEPLLPPLVLGGQEVPQIPAVKSFRVIYGGNAKGGCKCMVLLPGRRSLNVSSLTFLFNAPSCGYNATSAGAGKGPVLMSAVAHYFETCSYGHMSLPPDRNLVLGPIDLTDCSGVGPTMGRYALDGPVPVLRDGELYGLWDLAKEWMRKNRPDLFAERLRFDRKTLMFPLAAGVASLSNMGCPSNSDATGIIPDCLNWVSPAALSSPSPGVADAAALIRSHLLNNGLASPAASRAACGDAGGSDRSSCRTEPYGDPSDPMGTAEPVNAAGGVVCPAAPQSYTSGWAKAMLPLKGTPAAGEGFVPYEVPSMHTAETNFLRIAISQTGVRWAGSRRKQERAVFVSYRVASPTPGGYDTGLPASLSGRVWVHEYNQTADGLPLDPNMPPVLLAMLEAAGPTLALPDAFGAGDALHIRFVSKSNTTATVELCRNTLAVENVEDGTCFDALDNDCDGLTDFDDPDCQ
ncbi:hypothetical protein HXX76_002906 [Chlamydomonas incerta]|uniref:Peptidase M11 gametolysin domain-containing protein n=1 Tax=Chlamydomonas incerta TaxID=51695 RepID=A0A835W6Y2_CHLIN|nr:hypothetical protein HXX76_002906 [Chlamydomonas incerta]|eukprot:KAG2442827.1 hypothetical protein HXX76_002906 [Chlamydomonas incerta]